MSKKKGLFVHAAFPSTAFCRSYPIFFEHTTHQTAYKRLWSIELNHFFETWFEYFWVVAVALNTGKQKKGSQTKKSLLG